MPDQPGVEYEAFDVIDGAPPLYRLVLDDERLRQVITALRATTDYQDALLADDLAELLERLP